jgi:predicted metal-binding transcription factor (methanogenesis marker protein 9)
MKIQIKIKLLMTIAFSNGIAMEGYSDINDMVNGVINSCPLTKHINSLDFQPEEYSEQQLLKIQDILQKLNNGDKQPYLNFIEELNLNTDTMVNGVINSCPLTKHINSLDFQPEEYSEQQLLKIQDILQKLNNGDKQPYLNFMKELKSPVPTELIWNFFLTLLFSILLIVIF